MAKRQRPVGRTCSCPRWLAGLLRWCCCGCWIWTSGKCICNYWGRIVVGIIAYSVRIRGRQIADLIHSLVVRLAIAPASGAHGAGCIGIVLCPAPDTRRSWCIWCIWRVLGIERTRGRWMRWDSRVSVKARRKRSARSVAVVVDYSRRRRTNLETAQRLACSSACSRCYGGVGYDAFAAAVGCCAGIADRTKLAVWRS